jgi:hypothetical protein
MNITATTKALPAVLAGLADLVLPNCCVDGGSLGTGWWLS